MTSAIIIKTPHLVPSVNALYRNVTGKGRVKTKRYKEWAMAAGWDVSQQTRGNAVKGPYELSLTISRAKARANSDLSNRVKGVEDLLVDHGVIEDDKFCQRLVLEYGECDGMIIEIRPFFLPL